MTGGSSLIGASAEPYDPWTLMTSTSICSSLDWLQMHGRSLSGSYRTYLLTLRNASIMDLPCFLDFVDGANMKVGNLSIRAIAS